MNSYSYGIRMLTCSACNKAVTSLDALSEISVDTHFDITRSHKNLYVEGKELVEDHNGSDIKMERILCENCMQEVCNESPTMQKLFKVGSRLIW